jgi:hypothetical protein
MAKIKYSSNAFSLILQTAMSLHHDQKLHGNEPSSRLDLRQIFTPLESKQIDAFYNGTLKFPVALYLPTPEKNNGNIKAAVQPVLRIFRNSDTKLKIVLYILFVDEPSLKGYGFRYETPEGNEEKERQRDRKQDGVDSKQSMHCYYHSQLIFSDDDLPGGIEQAFRPIYDEFCPESIPAFPLPAMDEAELLICVLISLYGWNYFYKSWVLNTNSEELKIVARKIQIASGVMLG